MKVTKHEGKGFTRYLCMPGFYEAWVYEDGRPPVFAEQCAPVAAHTVPSQLLGAVAQQVHS